MAPEEAQDALAQGEELEAEVLYGEGRIADVSFFEQEKRLATDGQARGELFGETRQRARNRPGYREEKERPRAYAEQAHSTPSGQQGAPFPGTKAAEKAEEGGEGEEAEDRCEEEEARAEASPGSGLANRLPPALQKKGADLRKAHSVRAAELIFSSDRLREGQRAGKSGDHIPHGNWLKRTRSAARKGEDSEVAKESLREESAEDGQEMIPLAVDDRGTEDRPVEVG